MSQLWHRNLSMKKLSYSWCHGVLLTFKGRWEGGVLSSFEEWGWGRGDPSILAMRELIPFIPHICHFFYTGRIFESQYFTPKNYEKHPQITTNCPKSAKYAVFCVQSGKFYTGQNLFTQAPPVVPVTNMRIWSLYGAHLSLHFSSV